MELKNLLITKLAGHDILESEKELKLSLEKLQGEKEGLTKKIEKLGEKERSLNSSLEAARRENSTLTTQISALQRNAKSLNSSLEKLQGEKEGLIRNIDELREKEKSLNSSLDTLQREKEELTTQRDTLIEKEKRLKSLWTGNRKEWWALITEKQDQITSLKQENGQLRKQVDQLKNTLNAQKQEIEHLTEKVEALQTQNRSKQGTIMNNVKKINTLSEELSNIENEKSILSAQKEELGLRLNTINAEKASLESKNEDLQNELKDLAEKNSELEKKLATANKAKEEKEQECSNLLTQNDKLLEKEKQLIDENGRFKSENTKLQSRIGELEKEVELEQKHKKETELVQLKNETPAPSDTNEAKDEIENLKRQNESLQEQYNQVCKDNAKYQGEIENKKATIENLKKEKEDLLNKIHKTNEINNEEYINPVTEENSYLIISSSEESGGLPIDETKRTIDAVIDIDENKEISASHFFNQSENSIFKMRMELEKAIYLKRPKYVCKYCGQMVKISGRKTERGMARFFSHLRDSDECDCKTTTGKTKREINRQKFARCNEGERHKNLKEKLKTLLEKTSGVSNVQIESTIMGNHPVLRWRRPDVFINYEGKDIVFELQLSTTFASVIAERDLFYRLNKKFIIWVFNFDEQEKHVDLTNMMAKDIYYNNKLNVFIFDKEAIEESEKRGKLVLKCNWIKPDGNWHYANGNTSDQIKGKFITLSDLKFDGTFKPYYINAEKDYWDAHPEIKAKVSDIETENKRIIQELDALWKVEKEKQQIQIQKTEERVQELVEEYELNNIHVTKKYLLGQRNGEYGLITFDGEIRIPLIYDEIKVHRGWIEAKQNDSIDIFNENYTAINTGIRRIEKLNDELKKYVKETNGNLLWGIMTSRGLPLTDAKFSKLAIWGEDKILAVQNGKYHILDLQGKEILKNYDNISPLNSDDIAEVIKDGHKGYINKFCNPVNTEKEELENGMQKICQTGKWGILKEDKTIVVACQYDEIGSYKNNLIGIEGLAFSFIDENISTNCPVKVKYLTQNERNMLIFKVGSREAFMNFRQQQKAKKQGMNPKELTKAFISFANSERNLLYLSATPLKPLSPKEKYTDDSIPLGTVWKGIVTNNNRTHVFVKTTEGHMAFLHSSTWGEHTYEEFKKGYSVTIEKIDYDNIYNKHIWEIKEIIPN